jgi:hypothetical protein
MNFNPKTVASMQVFPGGIYQFEVIEGFDKVSEAGNPMRV